MTTIVHLIDDTTAGGVMRVLDLLRTDARLATSATHRVQTVSRGRLAAPVVEGADIIVSHLSVSWRSLPMLVGLRARYAHLPLLHVEHSYTGAFAALNVKRTRRFRTLLRTAYSLFDRIVAVSAAQAAWLKDSALADPAQVVTIASAVEVAPFLALPPVPALKPGQLRVIGAIGRLDPQKGFDRLIRAFRDTTNPDLRLRIIGDGPERAALEALATGDCRIEFTGFVEDTVAAMTDLDAVAMPSRWEAYGLVALEARAAGRPVLVAPVDGLADHAAAGAVEVTGHARSDWTDALECVACVTPQTLTRTATARAEAACATDRFAEAWNVLIAEITAQEMAASAA